MSKKFIVITGGSRGIGNALSNVLTADGHIVCSCGRSAKSKSDDSCHIYEQLDIRDFNAVNLWVSDVVAKYGAPDLLINNAAIINPLNFLESIEATQIKDLIDINVTGTIFVTKAFLPLMKKRRKGGVVGISSYWGREGAAQVVPYCASKFAIEGFSQSLAEELHAPMFSVCINPGIIDTNMLEICFGSSSSEYPNASDWAKAAAPFFLSLNRNHNGGSLTVPGF